MPAVPLRIPWRSVPAVQAWTPDSKSFDGARDRTSTVPVTAAWVGCWNGTAYVLVGDAVGRDPDGRARVIDDRAEDRLVPGVEEPLGPE